MDGIDQCLRRYLSAQSVVQPLMFVTFLATLLTPLFLWFFIMRSVCKHTAGCMPDCSGLHCVPVLW